jgi:dUTP pyrophosphatase
MTDYDYDEVFTISVDDIGGYITNTPTLNVWKLWSEAHLPKYGSEWAACFDLSASLRNDDTVKVYTKNNVKENRQIIDGCAYLASGERMLVPTGLVFDLRECESLRIHPRSGLSLKHGVVIANCEGVVDADYVQQTYVMLHNISTETFTIRDGDRIAQGEVVQVQQYEIVEAEMEPEEKTSRKGGFGSTGV